jgi:hypothetical protein
MSYNNLPIITPPRLFIKHMQQASWAGILLSLPQFAKYHNFHIDWQNLFYVLNDSENARVTSFDACKRKQFKIKLLLQLLPTFTIMNARYPQVYTTNTCFRCHTAIEDFDHIWSCLQNTSSLTDLIQKHKQSFLSHLKDLNKPNNDNLIDAIDQSSIWYCNSFNNNLCFVDLIKGIIPTSFSSSITSITKNKQLTQGLLSSLFDDIFSSAHNIWLSRCTSLQTWKISNNINDDFTIAWASSGLPPPTQTVHNNSSSFSVASAFGSHWSNFWYGSNHALPSGRLISVR